MRRQRHEHYVLHIIRCWSISLPLLLPVEPLRPNPLTNLRTLTSPIILPELFGPPTKLIEQSPFHFNLLIPPRQVNRLTIPTGEVHHLQITNIIDNLLEICGGIMSLAFFPEVINRFRLINDSNDICSKLLIMYTIHIIGRREKRCT